jgi:hypothetical protein
MDFRSAPSLSCLAAALCLCGGAALAQQTQTPQQRTAPAAAAEPRDPVEPNVRHSVIEDRGSRIEELRVRGQTQHIVVTPKIGPRKSYEIIPDGSNRDLADGSGASRGAAGKRVWNVLDF